MLWWSSFTLLLLAADVQAADASKYRAASTKETDKLFKDALNNFNKYYEHPPSPPKLPRRNAPPGPPGPPGPPPPPGYPLEPRSCTPKNAAVRREWTTLTLKERKAYTSAVRCLMNKPARYTSAEVPGGRSRYDDFVAVHIKQTLSIHGTANFLSWHRWFTYTYEQALRNECGYKGYQPYWNWGKSAFDPINSPYLDGSEGSMGGNGVHEFHNATIGIPTGLNPIPAGEGGGCVKTGPFKDFKVNLGPVASTLSTVPNQAGNGLNYNPRCLRRDISPFVSSRWNKDSDSAKLINDNKDVYWFQTAMQGFFDVGDFGVHTGGHFTYLGDPAGDLFASPGDPMFFLHHSQIDRTWWIWQNLDPAKRTKAISGTITLNNAPPSRNGTLDDVIDLEVNADPIKIGDIMSTVEGLLCYRYE